MRKGKRVADNNVVIPDYSKFVTVIDHPMAQHKLTILRDRDTGPKQFRELIKELAIFEGYEATRHFQLEPIKVLTPLCETTAYTLKGRKLAIVSMFRAGLGMVEGILELIPSARVGHVDLHRDPTTCLSVQHYCKLPEDIAMREVLIVDPVLATGSSASTTIELLKQKGVPSERIRLLVIVAAPEGIQAVVNADSNVNIYTCAIDEGLNERAYIVPGLGDAGDRIFGTG
jgi:uracil phosphoribosyltransferase